MLEKKPFNTLGTLFLPKDHTRFGEDILIADRNMPRKLNSKHVSSGGILLPVLISTCVLLRNLPMCDHTKFQRNDTETDDCSQCYITGPWVNGRSADPETPQMAKLYFRSRIWWRILNSESPNFYLSFLVTYLSISLHFRDIRVHGRQTDRQRRPLL